MVSKAISDIQDDDYMISDKDSIPSSSLHFIGLRNMLQTCYINMLLQWLLDFVPFRNSLLESHVDVEAETLFKK